ncbi:hypothetical protein B9Z19DRAFT_1070271 [Tuber borchii]|uniref:Uncharacterized protein n=1 Tax=Tuber borchii TaxID=42251 RepID=A0A2T7A9L4_TUBBO|nr:hypothetical protein B9Z19DRAFT_1070271 [Tuber borchii]
MRRSYLSIFLLYFCFVFSVLAVALRRFYCLQFSYPRVSTVCGNEKYSYWIKFPWPLIFQENKGAG